MKKPPSEQLNKKELVIYIYNIIEDEWPFLSSIQPISKRDEMISDCNVYTECYLYLNSRESEFIYVSPLKISEDFIKYFQTVTANKKVDIFVPNPDTKLICKDLYNDKKLFESLIIRAKKYKRIKLVSYAATTEFLELKEKLIKLGFIVDIPESPRIENLWTVNFYGSKSGIRQLAQQSTSINPNFIMPEGLICSGKLEAARTAADLYIRKKGVVLKTNKGSGGDGVIIFRDGELPQNYNACEKKIFQLISKNSYWEKFPIIVEELIKVNFLSQNIFPNIEFRINKNGKAEMLYYCTMKVTKEGKYIGLDMHESVLDKNVANKVIDLGYFIAKQYAKNGYRGHFDVDMIFDKNSHLYVSESNTRNTGGTDVYKLVRNIYGKDLLSDVYVLNRDDYKINPGKKVNFETVLKTLKPILVNHEKNEGVILSASKSLVFNQLSYTILGRNKITAYNLQKDFFYLMNKLN